MKQTAPKLESRFIDAVCSKNAAAQNAKLPESLTSFMLITNLLLDDNHRVSILSTAAPKPDNREPLENSMLLEMIKYKDVAFIVRSLDKPKNGSNSQYTTSRPPLAANFTVN